MKSEIVRQTKNNVPWIASAAILIFLPVVGFLASGKITSAEAAINENSKRLQTQERETAIVQTTLNAFGLKLNALEKVQNETRETVIEIKTILKERNK